eukprot:TRINITY_DN4650_c1_g1_i3.p1 TRINITY_DN4650_c1_g1~~TRINITY_DN4650_c1_g1_i3.p1  ORF type:complete len:421 (-),score=31.27 TRINITY_DN4650_c1_g1_i3:2438-3589(-)
MSDFKSNSEDSRKRAREDKSTSVDDLSGSTELCSSSDTRGTKLIKRMEQQQTQGLKLAGLMSCLDDELTMKLLKLMDVQELVKLSMTCKLNLAVIQNQQEIWRQLYEHLFGEIGSLQVAAQKMAGSWFKMVAVQTERSNNHPVDDCKLTCEYELAAFYECAIARKLNNFDKELRIVFLLDGSGSILYEQFLEMKHMVEDSVKLLNKYSISNKVGVVQFSTDYEYEIPVAAYEMDKLKVLLENLQPMGSTTSIYEALLAAWSILNDQDFYKSKSIEEQTLQVLQQSLLTQKQTEYVGSPNCHNLVLLLTDCMVSSSYQSAKLIEDINKKFNNVSHGILQFSCHHQNKQYEQSDIVDLFFKTIKRVTRSENAFHHYFSMPIDYEP